MEMLLNFLIWMWQCELLQEKTFYNYWFIQRMQQIIRFSQKIQRKVVKNVNSLVDIFFTKIVLDVVFWTNCGGILFSSIYLNYTPLEILVVLV